MMEAQKNGNEVLVQENWAEVVKKTMPGVPVVISPIGAGSGIVIGKDGLILTNKHVIEYGKNARLRFRSGEYPAVVVKVSDDSDLAIIKTYGTPEELECVLTIESEESGPGTEVIVLGHPGDYEETVTRGIVSAIREHRFDPHPPQDYLQIDAAINPGNSGGPVVNRSGKIVGLSTWKRMDHESVGFGIPAKRLHEFIDATTKEIDDGKIEIPTAHEVASLRFDPVPLQSIKTAIYGCMCKVTEVDRKDDDPEEMYSWLLKTEMGAELNVTYIDPCESSPNGYLSIRFCAIPEPLQLTLNSVSVLQALLTHNYATVRSKFAISDNGAVELVIERNADALDPIEVCQCVNEMIVETNRICDVILYLREYGKTPIPPSSLADLLPRP
jgi:hypothetical protein